MAFLRDGEIRWLLTYLRCQSSDSERLAEIEDELKSEFGSEVLREPKILLYFKTQKIEITFNEVSFSYKTFQKKFVIRNVIEIQFVTVSKDKHLRYL